MFGCLPTKVQYSDTPRHFARWTQFVRSLPSPTITRRAFVFFKTRARISTQSTGRFTGRKLETCTITGRPSGERASRKSQSIFGLYSSGQTKFDCDLREALSPD